MIIGMRAEKIAISIPSDILAGAERMARRLKKSRSQLISEAIADYVAKREPDAVTEAINRACEEADPELEAFVHVAARDVLKGVEW